MHSCSEKTARHKKEASVSLSEKDHDRHREQTVAFKTPLFLWSPGGVGVGLPNQSLLESSASQAPVGIVSEDFKGQAVWCMCS